MKQPRPSLRPFSNNSVNNLAIILIFGALVFVGCWVPGAYECFRYDRDGIQVEGIVTGHTGASYFGHSKDYFLTYRYFDRNKIPHIGKDTVEYPQWTTILDNTQVDVIYLKDDVESSRLKVSNHYPESEADSLAFAYILLGLACLLFVFGYWESSRRLKIINSGTETIAHAKLINGDGKEQARLVYTYQIGEGQFLGGYHYLSDEEEVAWREKLEKNDSTITVVYNRFKPAEHTVIGSRERLLR